MNKALKLMRMSNQIIEVGFTNNLYKEILQSEFLISPFSVEHFSRPIIEAFAHRKTAIGTDVEGMEEIIDNNINGIIIPKNNPKELAKAINNLIKNPNLITKLGESGYEKSKKIFSSKNVNEIQKIYQNSTQIN